MPKSKKQNQKPNNTSKSNYDLIIAFLLFFIAILELLNAGYFGILISDIFDILFGDAGWIISFYLLVISSFVIFKKTRLLYKTIYANIVNLILFTGLYIYHIYYLVNTSDVLKVDEYVSMVKETPEFLGSGVIIHTIDYILFTLFGGVGIIIPAILLIVIIAFLLIKIPFLATIMENQNKKAMLAKLEKEAEMTLKEDQEIKKDSLIDDIIEEVIYEKIENTTTNKFDSVLNTPFENDIDITTINQSIKSSTPIVSVDEIDNEHEAFSAIALKKMLSGEEDSYTTDMIEEIIEDEFVEEIIDDIVEPAIIHNKEKTNYKLPPIDLLKSYEKNEGTSTHKNYANEKGQILISTLASFKIKATIDKVNVGPNIIKYEIIPEIGTKVAKFSSLNNDIALALAASSVRIEAPIPGKSAIGIEIPNIKPKIIGLKEVLKSKINNTSDALQVGLGVDITGAPIFCDIKSTPHMLVAGSTGSGKSVCINSIIISILTKATPEEVKMVLIDPKKVELTPFNGVPHLLTPVVTDAKKAAYILQKMVEEMENRYELFAETNTRNISSYNEKSDDKLPYIVIVIDELADLMMVASRDVEGSIARLAQMARACGIHLIIATQRPSTDVITGVIKANIPTRISFAVSSSIDSRTILDSMGAEKLLGKGDMLIMQQTSPNLKRLQGAFLTDDEVNKIVEFTKLQVEEVEFVKFDTVDIEFTSNSQVDPLFETIKKDVIISQKASTSQFQRQYKIGYNRAMTIMEQLECHGIVAASEGTKPRRVLVMEDDGNN